MGQAETAGRTVVVRPAVFHVPWRKGGRVAGQLRLHRQLWLSRCACPVPRSYPVAVARARNGDSNTVKGMVARMDSRKARISRS